MTQPPPDDPYAPIPYGLSYQSVSEYGSAPLLVKLAGIFNLVAAGVDLLFAIGMIVLVIVMLVFGTPPAAVAPPRTGAPPGPTPAQQKLIVSLVYGIPAVLSLITAIIKFLGGSILLRRKRHAWAWGLTIGIIGCLELWTFFPCCLLIIIPMAAGVYTIVIVCLQNVRNFLAAEQPPVPQ